MAVTIVIVLVLGALVFFAVRHLVRHGLCEACDLSAECGKARGRGKGSGAVKGCAACPYYEQEKKWIEAAKKESARP